MVEPELRPRAPEGATFRKHGVLGPPGLTYPMPSV